MDNFHTEQPLLQNFMLGATFCFSQKYSDCVPEAPKDGDSFPCHRTVLATASSKFQTMLGFELSEGIQRHIILDGVMPQTAHVLSVFMYCNELPEVADFMTLLRLGHVYKIPKLVNVSAGKLILNMRSQTSARSSMHGKSTAQVWIDRTKIGFCREQGHKTHVARADNMRNWKRCLDQDSDEAPR